MKQTRPLRANRRLAMRGFRLTVALVAITGGSTSAQTIQLAETSRDGDCFRVAAETNLTGVLKVTRDGKQMPVKVVAKNDHQYLERTLAVEKGLVRKSARSYTAAASRATIG